MDPFTIIVAVIAVIAASFYLFRYGNVFKRNNIPHIPPLPIIGNMTNVLHGKSIAEWVQEIYNVDPTAKYSGMYDLMTPVIVLRDPELIKSVTVKNFDHFLDHRPFFDENADPLFGKNLFALRGDRWREIRGTLSPAFTSNKMKAMFKLMLECGAYFGDYIANLPESMEELDTKDAFTRYTNDVIASCAYGIRVDSMVDRDNKFYTYGREATFFGGGSSIKVFLIRSFPRLTKFFGIQIIRSEIAKFFNALIASIIKTRDEKGIVRPDMIQLMMETRGKMASGKDLTIEDMTAQAFVFFFGGFESTATTICFATHEIAVNPEVQKKLREEVDRVLEESDGDVTYEQINDMKYLDAVISETLRMYPVAVFADRICTKTFELPPALPGGKPYVLKPNSSIWIPIYGLQRDPKYFEEPEKFNPERFYNDPKKYANTGYYIPFGLGPRMCIGNRFALLETKAVIFHILARCELKPCSKTAIPMKLRKKGLSMIPENGFWLKVEKRKDIHPSLLQKVANGDAAH